MTQYPTAGHGPAVHNRDYDASIKIGSSRSSTRSCMDRARSIRPSWHVEIENGQIESPSGRQYIGTCLPAAEGWTATCRVETIRIASYPARSERLWDHSVLLGYP